MAQLTSPDTRCTLGQNPTRRTAREQRELFARYVLNLQSFIESFARSRVGDFAEDVAGETVLRAFAHLEDFEFSTGEEGARRWLLQILRDRIADSLRAQDREAAGLKSYAELQHTTNQDQAARHAMREDIEERLEMVRPRLSELEAAAMEGYIAGESDRAIARRLDISRQCVQRARLSALDKCREPRVVERPQISAAQWRAASWEGGNRVTIYHAPQRTGAGLAKMTPAQRVRNLLG